MQTTLVFVDGSIESLLCCGVARHVVRRVDVEFHATAFENLNNGANRFDKDNKLVGLPTGHITDYETYEDFEAAYFKQIDYFVKPFCEL